jgi:3-dehydroquinate dehydratase-2
MKYKILVLNGPNLNLLGKREPQIYGHDTLDSINKSLIQIAEQAEIMLESYQSNSESDLIEKTQSCFLHNYDFLIINPAAYTHTSIAWRDAVLAIKKPFIEIHLSNIFAREEFRHKSYFSDIAVGVISGLGIKGYQLALTYAIDYLFGKE